MTGLTGRMQAVRGQLPRLVAVFAVLAGLVLALGLQCTDGMTAMPAASEAIMATGPAHDCSAATMAAVDGASPDRVAPADTSHPPPDPCTQPDATRAVALVADGSPGSHGLGGVLMTCLAFIVAVVAAVAGFQPTALRRVIGMIHSAPIAVIRVAQLQPLSLAELCLLRT